MSLDITDMPIRRKPSLAQALKDTWRYAMLAKATSITFVLLAILSTLTEVISVSLLVPLLAVVGGTGNVFAEAPVLREISAIFSHFPDESRLQWLAGIMLVLIVIRGLLGLYSEVYRYTIPVDVERKLRLKATEILLNAEINYTNSLPIERVASYCVEFPARIGIAVRFAAMFLAAAIITLIYIGGLFIMNPIMAIVTFVVVVIFALLYRAITHRRVHIISQAVTDTRESFNRSFYETVQSTIEIRLAGGRKKVMRDTQVIVDDLMKVQKANYFMELSSHPFLSTAAGLVVCAIVFYIGLQPVTARAALIAPLFVFLALFSRLVSPLTMINVCRHHFSLHSSVYDDFETFIKEAEQMQDADGSVSLKSFDNQIELKDVGFGYTDDKLILRDLNVTLDRKGFIGIVGPSGSGKSTFALLLTRLYRPQSGTLLVDQVNIADIQSDDWVSKIGVARQGAFLPSRSVRDVISSNDDSMGALNRVKAVSKQALVDEFIEGLPSGYDTLLKNQGANFSDGQKQRIVLARALYSDPDILIIDEGVSGLDAITERAILKQIEAMQGRKMIVLITHDLRHVKSADKILVFDAKQIVQSGTYDELEAQDGVFRKMLYG